MKTFPTALRMGILAALLASPGAFAADVDYVPVEEEDSAIIDDLGDTFTRFAYSVDRWLKLEAPMYPELTHAKVFTSFESGFKKATVARVEYTFPRAGHTETVVYHAMSGTEPDEAFSRLLSKLQGLPQTPLSPAADQFDMSFRNVRAVSIDDELSDLQAIETADGLNHGADAELKALRSLEQELKTGAVPAGGTVRATVSKMPCQSCRTVFDTFGDLYQAKAIEVAYPMEESMAYKAFDTYRKTAFRTVRNNRATTEPVRSLQEFEFAIRRPPCP